MYKYATTDMKIALMEQQRESDSQSGQIKSYQTQAKPHRTFHLHSHRLFCVVVLGLCGNRLLRLCWKQKGCVCVCGRGKQRGGEHCDVGSTSHSAALKSEGIANVSCLRLVTSPLQSCFTHLADTLRPARVEAHDVVVCCVCGGQRFFPN